MNEQYPGNNEQEEQPPLYKRSDVIARAESDESLAARLRALELADQSRQVSVDLHRELEQAVKDHLRAVHPDLLPELPEPPQE